MDLGVHFDYLGHLYALFPVLIFSLSVDVHVELVNEFLDFILVFYGQEAVLEVLCKGWFLGGYGANIVASSLD